MVPVPVRSSTGGGHKAYRPAILRIPPRGPDFQRSPTTTAASGGLAPSHSAA